ncbi:MAG: hypothetical protein LBM98_12395 [Oscillospiraceae bacterium]|jgi:hypothetical protein|nr:hypothetical protein [Oscillospiraceae bacterium]
MSKLADKSLIIIFSAIMLSLTIYGLSTYGRSAWSSMRRLDNMDNVETVNIVAEVNNAPEFGEFIRPFDGFWIDINGLAARLLGQRELNSIYRLNNGQLSWKPATLDYVPNIPAIIEPGVSALTALNDFLAEQGGEVLFVMAPGKVSKYEDLLTKEAYDPENTVADAFLDALTANKVDNVDLREIFHDLGYSSEELFYITDHHWRAETGGFYAYQAIVKTLADLGFIGETDPMLTDIASFKKTTYEKLFLGYYGKRVGQYFGGVDDFVLIEPDFDTLISTEIPNWDNYVTGTWTEATIFKSLLEKRDYYNLSAYAAYGNSDFSYGIRKNYNAPIDKKLLVIGDSFGNVPYSLLTLIFREVQEIDMRTYNRDYAAYLEEYSPDITIVLAGVNAIGDENVVKVAP